MSHAPDRSITQVLLAWIARSPGPSDGLLCVSAFARGLQRVAGVCARGLRMAACPYRPSPPAPDPASTNVRGTPSRARVAGPMQPALP